ncbi:hypothetical protein E4T39_03285 [Aureobasidium subglaciale]|nr:hypothetical protein E4T39_03285 [Aureobasidium subglaciale]
MSILRLSGFLATALLGSRSLAQSCDSYGIDFQSNGNYFQNISSTDAFTFASLFEGCGNDVANNILVDPNGDEYQCTDTPLQPDDITQLSTCPMDKNQLWSGDWSVLIISNNGDADPIAYERDFYLTVGIPSTTTYTPTVTIFKTTTPLVVVTATSTIISTTTLPPKITNVATVTKSPTVTITPASATVVVTKTATLQTTAYTVKPILVTKTNTATCSIPTTADLPDPTATITPSLVTAAALSTDSASATSTAAVKYRRGLFDRAVPIDREARIAERKARRQANNKLQKRAPDFATTTLTETNTALYITSTSLATALATTITSTSVATSTSTVTPPVITVRSGTTTLAVVTTMLRQSTTTKTVMTISTTTVKTITSSPTVTITVTSTNTRSAIACTAKGGQMK